jgi:hypothetical protein
MQGRQKVEDAGCSQKARAVIAVGVGNVCATGFDGPGEEVKAASAEVGDITKSVKSIVSLVGEYVPFHGRAGEDEQTNR